MAVHLWWALRDHGSALVMTRDVGTLRTDINKEVNRRVLKGSLDWRSTQ
jgi:hypothetical protein